MLSILPEELHVEIPTGFNVAGHVGTSKSSSLANAPDITNRAQPISTSGTTICPTNT